MENKIKSYCGPGAIKAIYFVPKSFIRRDEFGNEFIMDRRERYRHDMIEPDLTEIQQGKEDEPMKKAFIEWYDSLYSEWHDKFWNHNHHD